MRKIDQVIGQGRRHVFRDISRTFLRYVTHILISFLAKTLPIELNCYERTKWRVG